MRKSKVFVSEPINQKGIDLLTSKVELVYAPDTSNETALKLIGDCEGAILRATTVFNAEVIAAAKKLKVIARTGVGHNNVDLNAASEAGIYVTITPGTNNTSVAEHVLALILGMGKQLFFMNKAVREGRWFDRFSPFQIDIAGKTVGVVGLGTIGIEVGKRCKALGMYVIGYDPYYKGGIDLQRTDDLDFLLEHSDFVTLHCPSVPETKDMINQKSLARMKPMGYLINTSRGDLVDETALIEALENKTIKGAAIDVFKDEPVAPDNPLLKAPNLIMSPHCAGSTIESNERIAVMAAQSVLEVFSGKRPKHICNQKQLAVQDE